MGYIRQSRSVNSMEAIESYEVPVSMINKSLLNDLQNEDLSCYDIDDKVFKLSVSLWKFVAINHGASSWHHTGKYFSHTDHYDLYAIAEYITSEYNNVLKSYKQHCDDLKREKSKSVKTLRLGYIRYQVWGGSRKHPKIIDRQSTYGYINDSGKKDWLINPDGNRFDIYANKVEELIEDDDLKSFKRKVEKKGLKLDLRHFKKFLRENDFKIN